ncbi:Splicing factor U2af small subunit A [Platanthera guangdongensis]|uniref:Splicing factor U2af small subunit A n=1 Tax=Platanthera guangdongensis TaxID=2320717 RepID=A0ABR2N044_9ASPA
MELFGIESNRVFSNPNFSYSSSLPPSLSPLPVLGKISAFLLPLGTRWPPLSLPSPLQTGRLLPPLANSGHSIPLPDALTILRLSIACRKRRLYAFDAMKWLHLVRRWRVDPAGGNREFEPEEGGGCSKRSFLGRFSRRAGGNGANAAGVMAEHLASIFGTEKDRVNCPFYFKIGACRHGDRCSRLHNKPTISPTLLLSNMYQRPDMITPGVDAQGQPIDPRKIQEHFEDFYEDIFEELNKFGEIESLNICDNLADHMVGNVYVQFKEEDQAAAALRALQGRFYSGRPIIVDFSPVTDFREATCRQFEENSCNRGGYCNFMHVKQIGRDLRRKLFGRYRRSMGSRSRSPSPHHRREYREYDIRERDIRGGRSSDRHGRYDDGGRRRYRSPRHSRSPVRDGSEERRARIEQWNREREERHV